MSILHHDFGGLLFDPTLLANSSATIVLEGQKNGQILNELQITNPTGSAVTCTVDIHDGTSVIVELDPGKSVTTTAKLCMDGIFLKDGRDLRVTGANGVYVWVSYYNVGNQPQFDANNTNPGLQS